MDITAEDYIALNHIHVEPVLHLIDQIKRDTKYEKQNITLDVGCGSGRITMLLHEAIGFYKIVAIDVAQDMIDSAINNYFRDNIEYLLQDISVNWDQLRPEIQALEGKVSLVFSNQVIHWIRDKDQTVKNLYRLLSTGGKVYLCLSAISLQYDKLSPEERQTINEILSVTSVQNQFDEWTNLLIKNKLTISKNELRDTSFTITERLWQKVIPTGQLQLLSAFAVPENDIRFNEFRDKHPDILLRGFDHTISKFVCENDGQVMVKTELLSIFTQAFKN